FFSCGEARSSFFNNECGDSMMSRGFVSDCHCNAHVAVGSVCRKCLLPIQDPMISVEPCDRLRASGVAAGFRFGQTPSPEFLAFRQRHHKAAALVIGSEVVDMSRA